MEHNINAVAPNRKLERGQLRAIVHLRRDTLHSSPDNGHGIAIEDGPVASPNAKTGSSNDREWDVVSCSWPSRHHHG
jgi:hypothetical protein